MGLHQRRAQGRRRRQAGTEAHHRARLPRCWAVLCKGAAAAADSRRQHLQRQSSWRARSFGLLRRRRLAAGDVPHGYVTTCGTPSTTFSGYAPPAILMYMPAAVRTLGNLVQAYSRSCKIRRWNCNRRTGKAARGAEAGV